MPDVNSIIPSSKTEDKVKTVLGWTSISYALGFITVTLHTFQLRLPVLEVLSSIYIWIGLPLAIVTYCSGWIFNFFKRQILISTSEIRTVWIDVNNKINEQDLNPLNANDADRVVNAFEGLPFTGTFMKLLKGPIVKLIHRINQGEPVKSQRAKIVLQKFENISKGINAMKIVLNYIYLALALIFAIYFYVWKLYPQIPQTLGGGKPRTIQLLVDPEKIAGIGTFIFLENKTGDTLKLKSFLTSQLKLLYKTKEQYYIECPNGERISISDDAVEAVIWNR